jgi:2,4-dienoyl-CoA reductase-like NADH-dependent reductase (Old Yellow Enzyme family)
VARQGQFQYLFTPIKLEAMTVPNRILMAGHATGYFNLDGRPTERSVNYLLARARGGAGLLITAPHHVVPLTSAAHPGPRLSH